VQKALDAVGAVVDGITGGHRDDRSAGALLDYLLKP
jgi:hypothetical protein